MSYDKTLKQSPVIIISVTVALLLGVFAGSISSRVADGAKELINIESIFASTGAMLFEKSVLSGFAWTGIVALGGMFASFIPFVFAALFAKGFFYGFTAGCIVASFGFKGIITVAAGLTIYNFLFFCLMIFYGSLAVTKSAEGWLNRKNYYFKSRNNKRFAIYTLIAVASVFIIAAAECVAVYFMNRFS